MNVMPHSIERCAGLVFGFVFRGQRGVAVRDDTLVETLEPGHDWVWLHLGLSDHRARRFLENFAPVPPAAQAFLLGNEDRLQIHLSPDCAYGVLPDLEQDFAEAETAAGRFCFWLDARHLVTVRRRPLHAVEKMHDAALGGLELASPAEALARLLTCYVELVESRLMALARDLDRIEDALLADKDGIDRMKLGPLRRDLSRYHREFASLRSAIHRAASGRRGPADGPLAPYLPPLLQEAEDAGRDAADLQDRARLIYEEIDTRISANTNRSLSALTVISTLLLPPTFVVGAFGMNVEGLPWSHGPEGFAIVIGLCLLLVGAGYLMLRRFRIMP